MKLQIVTVALGGWYPRGVARMIEAFERVSPGHEITAFVNVMPGCAPSRYDCTVGGFDYSGYVAKAFALQEALEGDADAALLLDASVYPVRSIAPMVEHIERVGYFLARGGFTIGEWSTDTALKDFGLAREEALHIPDVLSGCVGFMLKKHSRLIDEWAELWRLFLAPHSNAAAGDKTHSYKNEGFVSADTRVRGHRHDQTVLSLLAYRNELTELVEMPHLLSYAQPVGQPSESTVLVVEGM